MTCVSDINELGSFGTATRGKSINLFLMDGDPGDRIKCTLANWTGVAYKIPRIELDKCKGRDDLSKPNFIPF